MDPIFHIINATVNTNPTVYLCMALRMIFNANVYFFLSQMATMIVVLLMLLWLNLGSVLILLMEQQPSLYSVRIFHIQIRLAFQSSKDLVEPLLTISLGTIYVTSIFILWMLVLHWEELSFLVCLTLLVFVIITLVCIWVALKMIKDINEISDKVKRRNVLRARVRLVRASSSNSRNSLRVHEKDFRAMPSISISCAPFHFIDNTFLLEYYSTMMCRLIDALLTFH